MDFVFDNTDTLIDNVQRSLEETASYGGKIYVGVDLGTAYIVLVALGENTEILATEMVYAEVVRDGLVVDYMKACQIVKTLKEKLEKRLGTELDEAAIAVPPGTHERDTATHRYVVESSGLRVCRIVDEPEAANIVLGIGNGAVVDVGGGTTGVAVFRDGKMIYSADEPTGGTHLTLTVAGHYKVSFEEAEKMKTDKSMASDIYRITLPVIEKVASIITRHVRDYGVDTICLVGGSPCLPKFEEAVEKATGIKTVKPKNPFLVTPLGIAMSLIKNKEA